MSYLMSNHNNNNAIITTLAIITALGLIATVFAVPQAAEAAPKPKVTICHDPEEVDDPTTPDEIEGEPKTKTLPAPAAAAHLRNHEGDTPGPCPPTLPPLPV